MSRPERIQLVGKLVVELEESVQNLKRAQQQGQDWLPHLSSIADCFDKEKSTKILMFFQMDLLPHQVVN